MQAVKFTADDGVEVHGYLTRKNQKANRPQPMVIIPHGGPYGVRDRWGYDYEVQALASKGYAVLQVNFRGSSGYGRRFYTQGLREWGGRIQQDIIQSVQWSIKENIADPNNICIMGASFGAYSAVMSATLEPDMFKCAVANVGVYDLEMLYDEGDIKDAFWGEAYLAKAIGKNREQLKQFSPVNHIKSLKAELFIAHGERDQRAPIEHAEALKKALDENNKKYQWFVKETEGHGYYSDKNRAEYLTKVVGFIDKHIGKHSLN